VEAVFEGEIETVRKMVGWCRAGPTSAQVDDVQVEYEASTGEFRGFHIR
jgi:acylphosphatase